jgi:hypothetical protein
MLLNGLDEHGANKFGSLTKPITLIETQVDAFSRLISKL